MSIPRKTALEIPKKEALEIPRKTAGVILAGQSPIRRPERLLSDMVDNYQREGEWPIWDRYKPLIQLETIGHSRFRLIDPIVAAARKASLLEDFVVVGTPELGEYLGESSPDVCFEKQGDSIAQNMEKGYKALRRRNHSWLDKREMALFLFGDTPMVTHEMIDALIVRAQTQLGKAFTQNHLIGCVDVSTVGRYERHGVRVLDDLFSDPQRVREMKESNFIFASGMAGFSIFDVAYDHRKFFQPANIAAIAQFLFLKGAAASGVRIGIEYLIAHPKVSRINRAAAKVFGDMQAITPTIGLVSTWPEYNWDVDSDEDIARLGCTMAGQYPEHKLLVAPKPGHEEEFGEWWGVNGRLVRALRPNDVSNRENWAMSVEDTLGHLPDGGRDGRFLVSRSPAYPCIGRFSKDGLCGMMNEAKEHVRYCKDLGFYGMQL
jgi:hypothetical protein